MRTSWMSLYVCPCGCAISHVLYCFDFLLFPECAFLHRVVIHDVTATETTLDGVEQR